VLNRQPFRNRLASVQPSNSSPYRLQRCSRRLRRQRTDNTHEHPPSSLPPPFQKKSAASGKTRSTLRAAHALPTRTNPRTTHIHPSTYLTPPKHIPLAMDLIPSIAVIAWTVCFKATPHPFKASSCRSPLRPLPAPSPSSPSVTAPIPRCPIYFRRRPRRCRRHRVTTSAATVTTNHPNPGTPSHRPISPTNTNTSCGC